MPLCLAHIQLISAASNCLEGGEGAVKFYHLGHGFPKAVLPSPIGLAACPARLDAADGLAVWLVQRTPARRGDVSPQGVETSYSLGLKHRSTQSNKEITVYLCCSDPEGNSSVKQAIKKKGLKEVVARLLRPNRRGAGGIGKCARSGGFPGV